MMEISKAAVDALRARRREYDDHIRSMLDQIATYYEQHGHTNNDWAKAKCERLQSERAGFVEAARIMGMDIRD